MKAQYRGLKIIVGRDKLDHSTCCGEGHLQPLTVARTVKGVREKLLGFERFLDLYPDWVGRVVLVQIATATANSAEVQSRIGQVLTRVRERSRSPHA